MFITYVEIKYGLLAMVIIAVGLLALVMLISGAHLLAREIGRSARRRRARALVAGPGREQLYSGAGD